MALTTNTDHRDSGLVWLESELAAKPATHLLIAGIGRFDTLGGATSISSPPISARQVASWFLDGAARRGPGFANPARPLASLAVLLSEAEDGSPSEIEGGPVPRASFQALKAAVRAWIDRAKANPLNTMILFLASHGISAGRRTAILCEDYGTDRFDAEAGMIEVEQFVVALGQVDVLGKLLIFDCCRTEGETMDPNQTLGNKLIGAMATPVLPRRPQVMRSTMLGQRAYGHVNGPTLFTKALLEALSGLAASPNEHWQIGSTRLCDVTNNLLGLNVSGARVLQDAELELTRSFPVAKAEPTDRVALFLTIEAPWAENDWAIDLVDTAGNARSIGPAWVGARHARVDLPAMESHAIRLLDDNGAFVAEIGTELAPPSAFLTIPDPYASVSVRTVSAMLQPKEQPRVILDGLDAAGAIARFISASGASLNEPTFQPRFGVSTGMTAGRHLVEISRADGAKFRLDLNLQLGEQVAISVQAPTSPHEWMMDAVKAGVIAPGTRAYSKAFGPAPELHTISADDARRLVTSTGTIARLNLEVWPLHGPSDGRFHLFEFKDSEEERYLKDCAADNSSRRPVWAFAKAPAHGKQSAWHEIAFVPTLGGPKHDFWHAAVLADTSAADGSHLVSYATAGRWASLLAFLGRRDFPNGAEALGMLLGEELVQEAVWGKAENPLAAIAGALTAIACGPIEKSGLKESWLENLANWFPGLPDGQVVLGRHLLRQGRTGPAREAFRAALNRGIPVFSLAVDWLAEGLQTLDPDAADPAIRWSLMADPRRTFTVLSLATPT